MAEPPTTGSAGVAHGSGHAWAELLRLPALFTVPGDALAGAAATTAHLNSRTLLAIGSSLCLYEAGMALNDWADRAEDALERPRRPLPSGRVRPAAAFAAACGLTGAGLALAARAGRPALAVAVPLAGTVWAYDLVLKHTPAGPAAMATARALDLLLGAAATSGRTRRALPSAVLLGTHTLAVTTVSRRETTGGSPLPPLAALATTVLLSRVLTHGGPRSSAGAGESPVHDLWGGGGGGGSDVPGGGVGRELPGVAVGRDVAGDAGGRDLRGVGGGRDLRGVGVGRDLRGNVVGRDLPGVGVGHELPGLGVGRYLRGDAAGHDLPGIVGHVPAATAAGRRRPEAYPQAPSALGTLTTALAAAYAATAGRPYLHAALNPSPPLTQRAVGGGIRATIPLQAALTARSGAGLTALFIAGLAPLARRFGRKVSVT